MEAGILHVVPAAGRGYGADIADMLDHGRQRQGHDGEHCRPEQPGINLHIKQMENSIIPDDGQTYQIGCGNSLYNLRAGGGVKDEGEYI